jgi:hypothetical protein
VTTLRELAMWWEWQPLGLVIDCPAWRDRSYIDVFPVSNPYSIWGRKGGVHVKLGSGKGMGVLMEVDMLN